MQLTPERDRTVARNWEKVDMVFTEEKMAIREMKKRAKSREPETSKRKWKVVEDSNKSFYDSPEEHSY